MPSEGVKTEGFKTLLHSLIAYLLIFGHFHSSGLNGTGTVQRTTRPLPRPFPLIGWFLQCTHQRTGHNIRTKLLCVRAVTNDSSCSSWCLIHFIHHYYFGNLRLITFFVLFHVKWSGSLQICTHEKCGLILWNKLIDCPHTCSFPLLQC